MASKDIKVIAVEVDGIDQEESTEYLLHSEDCNFVDPNFTQIKAQAAIVQANKRAAVSAVDTLPNYLFDKIVVGSNKITKSLVSPGGDEKVAIDLGTVLLNDIADVDTISTPPSSGNRLEWELNKWVPSDPTVYKTNQVCVSKNGVDTNSGTIDKPVLTIAKALEKAVALVPSLLSPVQVLVGPGTYTEVPLLVPSYVVVEGENKSAVTIKPQVTTSHLITLDSFSYAQNLVIEGLVSVSNYHIAVLATAVGTSNITNVDIKNGTNGIHILGGLPGAKCSITHTDFQGVTGTLISANTNSDIYVSNSTLEGVVATSIGIEVLVNGKLSVRDTSFSELLRGVDTQNIQELSIKGCKFINTVTPIQSVAAATLRVEDSSLDWDASNIAATTIVDGYALDIKNVGADQKLRVFDELSVGTPVRGTESAFGEGDSYVNGMLVYTFDGVSFVDVSGQSRSDSGSTFTFPGVAPGSSVYVASKQISSETGSPVSWEGIKVSVLTPAVGGEIVVDYWDGVSWIELNHMSTSANGKYLPFAKTIFQRAGEEQVRFDSVALSNQIVSDPVSLGSSYNWIRFRVITTLTVAPIFEQFKIHTNRCEINKDGYVEYFGKSRPVGVLPIAVGPMKGTDVKPKGNENDLFLGDILSTARKDNAFQSGFTEDIGIAELLPYDIDTSIPLRVTFYFTSHTGVPGTTNWVIRWNTSKDNDAVYVLSATSPAISLGEQSTTVVKAVPALNTQFSFSALLDISDAISRRAVGPGDIFWMSLQREGTLDTFNDEVNLIQIAIEYTKSTNGGHL